MDCLVYILAIVILNSFLLSGRVKHSEVNSSLLAVPERVRDQIAWY